jgi:hypothetical protein
LQELRRRGGGGVEGDDDEQNELDEDEKDEDEDEERSVRKSRKRSDGPTPTQLGFYPHVYRNLLVKAKKQCRLEALDNPFPDRETFLAEDAIEILAQIHNEFALEGRGVEEGYWEKHKHDMAIVVFFLLWTWLIPID